jgi:hypothetical protein
MLGRGQAEHFSASQGAEQADFLAQNSSAEVEELCRTALAVLEGMKVLMTRITATLFALQFTVFPPRYPQQRLTMSPPRLQ